MSKEFTYTEEVTGEIVQIPVELLHHHHDNPRKDLGDLTELTDSIKAKGVMQNLTVVPYWFKITGKGCDDPKQQAEMGYLVVIGNRRLEAAKKAGLETLPCIIAKMTPAEQIQTMLLENMQRSDLTVYEQAQGFQMMMDFGDTIETVAEKTGFSTSTIRRRLKMAELDADVLKAVSDRQMSLMDFDRLAQIEDLDVRNSVLKEIGTANFENKLKQAIQEQNRVADTARWKEAFEKIGAKEIAYRDTWSGEYAYVNPGYFEISQDTAKLEKAITEGEQYYYAFNGSAVYLRTKKKTSDEDDAARAERERREADRRERGNRLEEAFKRAFELRSEYVKGLSNTFVKKNYDAVIAFLVQRRWTPNNYVRFDYEVYSDVIGAEIEDESDMSYDLVKEQTEANTFKALLAYAYAFSGDSESMTCKNWNNIYRENENLETIYEFLTSIGYEMSDEEKDLLDGTSELYCKPEEDDAEDIIEDDDLEDEEAEEDDLEEAEPGDDALGEETDESEYDKELVSSLKEMYGAEDAE